MSFLFKKNSIACCLNLILNQSDRLLYWLIIKTKCVYDNVRVLYMYIFNKKAKCNRTRKLITFYE